MFVNQTNAVNTIISRFESGERHIILAAQMQSGKTGVITLVSKKFLQEHPEFNVLYICALSDTLLKKQAISDFQDVIPTEYKDRVNIKFLQDFKTSVFEIKINTLIIIDESDRDSTKGQSLDKLLLFNNIKMDGNTLSLESRNYYILSVSATPFAELSDSHHQTSFLKNPVILTPGESYKGINDFYTKGNIRENFDIMKNYTKLINILQTFCEKKYALIRTNEKSVNYDKLYTNLSRYNIQVVNCFPTSRNTQLKKDTYIPNIDDFLSHPPTITTVVVIHNILRAGKRIQNKAKENIGMVWEGSIVGNTDSILQGLPGRCCGYHDNTDIQMFIPKNLLTNTNYKKKDAVKSLPNEIENYIQYYIKNEEMEQDGAGKYRQHEKKEIPRIFRHAKNPLKNMVRNATTIPMKIEKDNPLYNIMELSFTIGNRKLTRFIYDEIHKSDGGMFKETMTSEQYIELKDEVFSDPSTLDSNHHNFTCRNAINETTYDVAKIQEACYKKQTLSSNIGIVKRGNNMIDIACVFIRVDKNVVLRRRYRNMDLGENVYYIFFRTKSRCPQPIVGTTGKEIFATYEEDIFADEEEIYVQEAIECGKSVEEAKRRAKISTGIRKNKKREHMKYFVNRLPGTLFCHSPKELYGILKNIVKVFKKYPHMAIRNLNKQSILLVENEISINKQREIEDKIFRIMGVRIHAIRNRGPPQEGIYKGIRKITINKQ